MRNDGPSRILVAGCTGYVGRYVVRELAERGYRVRALTRNEERLREAGPFESPEIRDACDEIAIAEVTRPETLATAFQDVDCVVSSVGISRQRDGLTFDQVDHQANRNLVDQAVKSGVRKFVYVSLWDPEAIAHLEIVAAHEKVVDALEQSGLEYTIVRPSGYFSDMGVLLDMAERGRSFVIGDGSNEMNPIHGADVARVCGEAITSSARELGAGGPDVFTQHEAKWYVDQLSILFKPSFFSGIKDHLEMLLLPTVRDINHPVRLLVRHSLLYCCQIGGGV